MIFDQLALGQISYVTGTSGSVTVPEGCVVIGAEAASASGNFTITITPNGPMQSNTTGPTITSLQGGWALPDRLCLGQLGPGTVLVFASTETYAVYYSKRV